MAIKLSVAVKNARLDAIETAIGASAVLKIRSGAAPAGIADADSGTVLATLALPADWLAAAGEIERLFAAAHGRSGEAAEMPRTFTPAERERTAVAEREA